VATLGPAAPSPAAGDEDAAEDASGGVPAFPICLK